MTVFFFCGCYYISFTNESRACEFYYADYTTVLINFLPKILLTAALFCFGFWLKNVWNFNLIIQLFVFLFACAQTIFRIFNFLRFLRIAYTLNYGWKFLKHKITHRKSFQCGQTLCKPSQLPFLCVLLFPRKTTIWEILSRSPSNVWT